MRYDNYTPYYFRLPISNTNTTITYDYYDLNSYGYSSPVSKRERRMRDLLAEYERRGMSALERRLAVVEAERKIRNDAGSRARHGARHPNSQASRRTAEHEQAIKVRQRVI
jgi:hypothetical protein